MKIKLDENIRTLREALPPEKGAEALPLVSGFTSAGPLNLSLRGDINDQFSIQQTVFPLGTRDRLLEGCSQHLHHRGSSQEGMAQLLQILPELQIIQVRAGNRSDPVEGSGKVARNGGDHVRITAGVDGLEQRLPNSERLGIFVPWLQINSGRDLLGHPSRCAGPHIRAGETAGGAPDAGAG